MNCQEFEEIVNDLAGGRTINAESRVRDLGHSEICERCASRLADERALSAGLKSLASIDEGKAAPEKIEAALLESFRARRPGQITRSARKQPKIWPRRALAAAAAIAIVFGFIIYLAVRSEPQNAPTFVEEAKPQKRDVNRDNQQQHDNPVANNDSVKNQRRNSHELWRRQKNRNRLDRFFIRDSMTSYSNESEYTTEFFSLSHGDSQTPMESGEVIRVQMPRSALITLGLPVNIERADEQIKADLLLGEDGLARAIRFVH